MELMTSLKILDAVYEAGEEEDQFGASTREQQEALAQVGID
jgi:hypothetical protein